MKLLFSILLMAGSTLANTADFIGAEVTCSNDYQNLSFKINEINENVEVSITQFRGPGGELYVRSMVGTLNMNVLQLAVVPGTSGVDMLFVALEGKNSVIGMATTEEDLTASEIAGKADIFAPTEKGDKLTFDGSTVSCQVRR